MSIDTAKVIGTVLNLSPEDKKLALDALRLSRVEGIDLLDALDRVFGTKLKEYMNELEK